MPADVTLGLHKYRAALFCAVLLAGVTGLASLLVSGQREAAPMGAPVRPGGWELSFQPPAGWRLVPGSDYGVEDAVALEEPEVNHSRRVLFVGRRGTVGIGDAGRQAASFIHEVEYQGILSLLVMPKFQVSARPGSSDGMVVQDPRTGTAAIAVRMGTEWAYCAAMTVEGRALERRDLVLLEQVVRSFEGVP